MLGVQRLPLLLHFIVGHSRKHDITSSLRTPVSFQNKHSFVRELFRKRLDMPRNELSLVPPAFPDKANMTVSNFESINTFRNHYCLYQKHYIPFPHARARTLIKKSRPGINFPFLEPIDVYILLTFFSFRLHTYAPRALKRGGCYPLSTKNKAPNLVGAFVFLVEKRSL